MRPNDWRGAHQKEIPSNHHPRPKALRKMGQVLEAHSSNETIRSLFSALQLRGQLLPVNTSRSYR
jgi:hypothetical protein